MHTPNIGYTGLLPSNTHTREDGRPEVDGCSVVWYMIVSDLKDGMWALSVVNMSRRSLQVLSHAWW